MDMDEIWDSLNETILAISPNIPTIHYTQVTQQDNPNHILWRLLYRIKEIGDETTDMIYGNIS